MGFMAAIFNTLPGLAPPDEETAKLLAGVEDDEEMGRVLLIKFSSTF